MNDNTNSQLDLKTLLMQIRAPMSQKKMAEVLGISAATLANIENNVKPASPEFLNNCINTFRLSKAKAFELYTAAYAQYHSIQLDLDVVYDISQTLWIKKETIIKLIAFLTKGMDVNSAIRTEDNPVGNRFNQFAEIVDQLWDYCCRFPLQVH